MRGQVAQYKDERTWVGNVPCDHIPATGVPLYGIMRDGSLEHYPKVRIRGNEPMLETYCVLKIGGMTCGHCSSRVQKALVAVPGVRAAEVDLEAGTATLIGEATIKALVEAVEATGKTAEWPETTGGDMPSEGEFTNPDDKSLVRALEDQMIEAYGKVIVETKCKAGAGGEVDLEAKMIRDCHVEALCEAVNKYGVKRLYLNRNQLGDAGADAIAAMLRTNRSLTVLWLSANRGMGDAGKKKLWEAVEGRKIDLTTSTHVQCCSPIKKSGNGRWPGFLSPPAKAGLVS